jgi:hypothetical protein
VIVEDVDFVDRDEQGTASARPIRTTPFQAILKLLERFPDPDVMAFGSIFDDTLMEVR